MKLLLNELSMHGQFQNTLQFAQAIDTIMSLRAVAKQFGRDVYCGTNMAQLPAVHQSTMLEEMQRMSVDKKRALMHWLSRVGPHWEESRQHSSEDYFSYGAEVVTDTALGEAASLMLQRQLCGLVSFAPSAWLHSVVLINYVNSLNEATPIEVENYWDSQALECALKRLPRTCNDWSSLEQQSRQRYTGIYFSDDCFDGLNGVPVSSSAINQIMQLLDTLNQFKQCFDAAGQRTSEGHEIYQKHFTGTKAWFTDSSDSEKNEFSAALIFKHPAHQNKTIECPWHGKVKTPQLRIHFSMPVTAKDSLYVVYIGPKLTKR